MKKIFPILISVFMLFGLTGCFSEEDSGSVTDISGSAKTSFNINETAVYNDVYYTITNVEYSNGDDWDSPAEGKQYVIVTINIENKSEDKISYNTYDWTMLNSQGQEDEESFTIIDSDTNLGSGELIAGGSKTGTIVFEENKNESSLKLLYYSDIFWNENHTIEFVIK